MLLTNSSRSKDLKGGLNSFFVVISIQCNHPGFKKLLKCSRPNCVTLLSVFFISNCVTLFSKKKSIRQGSQQKSYETKKLTLNSFFSSLVDGRLPPWLLTHCSAILIRRTTYGVCLRATGSCASKSMLSAKLLCENRQSEPFIWNTRCVCF